METFLRAGTFFLALSLGAAGAFAQTNPGDQPGKEQSKAAPAPEAGPTTPAPQPSATHPRSQSGAMHPEPQVGHTSINDGVTRPRPGPSPDAGDAILDRRPDYGRQVISRPAYGVVNRWHREAGYARSHTIRSHRFVRYRDTRATWLPRHARAFAYAEFGYRRTLRYGYAPRFSYYGYGYRPRVRYAYAETPYAYDLPRDTYATGLFVTKAALGLHSYDYAYTTQVRPIAAYGGPTGSYAGGSPIYNRPLAPAYPTPGCDCDY